VGVTKYEGALIFVLDIVDFDVLTQSIRPPALRGALAKEAR
jgi:hypothetical protein